MQVSAAPVDPVAVTPDGSIEAIGTPGPSDAGYPPAIQGWYCVAVLALAVMINFLDRGILPLLAQQIKADLHIGDVQMGLVMGFAFTFFYAIFGFPVALLIDRKSRKWVFSAGLAIFAVMTVVTGFARSYWQLFAARVGMGIGETTSGPSAYSLMSDYFPPHRLPRAISVMQIGFVAGTGLASVVGAAMIDLAMHHPGLGIPALKGLRDWQVVMMLTAIPGFLVALLMTTVREPPRRGAKAEPAPLHQVFSTLWRHRAVYLPLFIGMGLRAAQSFGTMGFGPAFFQRTYGWSPQQVGYISGPISIVAMFAGLALGNWLAERYWKQGRPEANVRVVVVSTLISVPLGVIYPLMPSPWLALVCSSISGLAGIMAASPENAAIQSITPNRLRGQMTFLFLFVMNVIGMGVGPLIAGMLSQYVFGEENIRYAIALMGLACGVPAIWAFWRGMPAYGRAYAAGGVEPA